MLQPKAACLAIACSIAGYAGSSLPAFPGAEGFGKFATGCRQGEYVKGVMDEVRIENRARSPEWIRFCYLNQKENSSLVLFTR